MLLDIRNLDVSYGAIAALRGVSLRVDRGEIVALVGANGAGKTTLLRTVSGLLRPTAGSITFHPTQAASHGEAFAADGPAVLDYAGPATGGRGGPRGPVELQKLKPHQIVRLGVAHSPEGRQVFPNLTVRENLLIGGYQQRDRAKLNADLDHGYSLFPVLAERRGQKAGTLSGGEQQMLAMARALMQRPALLLLDEPSLGLAPLVVRKIFEIVRAINAEGTTVFLVEQNAKQALSLAHRAYVLQTGQVVKSDDARVLLNDPDVKRAYLGG